MRGSSTGDPASHRTQDKRSHPASGAQAGTGRSALRPETVAEMRGASEKRPSAAIMPGRRLRIQRNLGHRNKPLAAFLDRAFLQFKNGAQESPLASFLGRFVEAIRLLIGLPFTQVFLSFGIGLA